MTTGKDSFWRRFALDALRCGRVWKGLNKVQQFQLPRALPKDTATLSRAKRTLLAPNPGLRGSPALSQVAPHIPAKHKGNVVLRSAQRRVACTSCGQLSKRNRLCKQLAAMHKGIRPGALALCEARSSMSWSECMTHALSLGKSHTVPAW